MTIGTCRPHCKTGGPILKEIMKIYIYCVDIEEMDNVARQLSRHLRPNDIILFTGPLGVGKTHLVKSITRALGSREVATSPTFSIVNFYSSPQCPIIHIDAYRMHNLDEYKDLGLDDYFPTSIIFVEWGNLVAELYPSSLTINIEFSALSETKRNLLISCASGRWKSVLDAFVGFPRVRPS
jgi:tRNA threonylcarbamoyladenosine biosynthesis protein TsaE